MTDRGPANPEEVVNLVHEAALQRGFYWVGIGHAYAGDEPLRPAYWPGRQSS